MNIIHTYLGQGLALATAVVWALAVILFKKSGETVHPVALNLFKNVQGSALFLPTLLIFGVPLLRDAPVREYLILLLSGALGIGIADTFFFMSLNLLGAGLSAIVDCLYSPFVIALSMIWLGETLNGWQFAGAAMIVAAVLVATVEPRAAKVTRRHLALGIVYAVIALFVMAIGIVMAKPILEHSPVLWVTEWRLLGGIGMLAVVLMLHPRRWPILLSLFRNTPRGWLYTIGGSFVGAYLALVLWLGGMKYTQASIAAALNQTSNIFVFILAALLLKEKINLQRTVGIALGVAGALLVALT